MVAKDIEIRKTAGIWHLIAGMLMALLGVFIWLNPAATLLALALYIGIVFIVVGAGYFAASFSFRSGWYLLVGILDILVGIVFVSNLGVSAASLPIIFAIWCLAVGAIQVASAFQLRSEGFPWGWTLGVGLLGIVFGFLILAYPALGALTITALMGAYVMLYGLVEVAEYFYTKRVIVQ